MPKQHLAHADEHERARERHVEALDRAVLSWFAAHGVFCDSMQADGIATVSASFASFCSPEASSFSELSLAAKFIAMFFLLDDAPDDDVVEHLRHVETCSESAGHSVRSTALDRLLADITGQLRTFGVGVLDFTTSWHRTCSAVNRERRLRGKVVSAEQLFEVRQQTIAVHPYIHLWYIMHGLTLDERETTATDRLRHLVAEEVILCNDLASIEKDSREGSTEPNYVLFLQQSQNIGTIATAAELVIERYNRQLLEIESERHTCLAGQPGFRMEQITYLALMLVDGTVKASRRMVNHRYSDDGLQRLLLLNT